MNMDKILEAVMMSPHSRAVKEGMVRRVIGSAPQPLDRAQCMAMFDVATKLFLLGESQFKQDVGREVLEAFAQHHQQDFEEFFNVRFILDLLQEGYASLGKRSPQIFDYLQVGLRYIIESPSSEELFHLLQIEVLRIVCERPGPELCARIAKLLNQYPQCVPSGNLQTVFCQQLIQTIRLFQCQCDGDDDIVAFLEHVTKTSGMLQSVWRTNMATILPSLKELFIVISSPAEGGSVPSNALASVVQYVPLELMEGVVRNLTNDKNISDAQMLIAICRMMDWLSWPFTKNIDKWIIALMKGVAAVKKCAILIEVTLTKIEEVFSKLFYPIVREGALSMLSYLLLSFQQSPEAFHLLLPQIPQLISALSAEESDSARHCLAQMVELTHCLLFRFSGFPDLYQPVLELIKDLPVPNEERMKQLLRQSAWAPQKTEQVSFCHRLAPKSQTGKTGLVNLGNTCYMNSVIQALFMASDFRRAVMSLKNCDLLPLMGNLQRLFAFLEHSQRPAISPDSFLVASIPAWFTPGTQQDCSEYLKYLLDRLHEEEKRSHQKTRGSLAGSEENGTLIKKMFGGKMVTRIRCLRCQNISRREEALTDLSLALPPPDHSPERSFIISPSPPVVEVIGPSSLSPSKTQSQTLLSPKRNKKLEKPEEHGVRVVPVETIGDIDKAVPLDSNEEVDSKSFSHGTSGEPISGSEASLSVPDLINFFLSPEMLTGENKYHCQRCSSLQNAEKVVEVTEGPHYLILTLLRFSFDVVTMRRKKILDNVSIPLVLKIPIRVTSKDPASAEAGKLYPESSTEGSAYVSMTYDLGSVVVHSGLSSESGHYYCYARECDYGNLEKQSNTGAHISSQQPTAENQWFLFNDTRVSFSSFESVSNVTTYFPKDTAYVMFYRLRPSQHVEADRECISAADNLHVGESLHKELSEAITKDNTLHLQEQEREVRHRAALSPSSAEAPVWLKRPRSRDEKIGHTNLLPQKTQLGGGAWKFSSSGALLKAGSLTMCQRTVPLYFGESEDLAKKNTAKC
ncbi:ubiquitin carboxyl-terminal hydrolase 35 isoform X2 [Lepisosteus oculatus]|uniref:Ubiquitin specific peptidase 35 n=1 Tax=Lepisosteus oculatus TaxID=7918 RepID=W5MEU8_LEPOC|nr:PREDICTED: ubiquitin carboxyl-terminal hydrolase 35 isoform X2 [Lepisosteus oculatus]